MRRSPPTSRPSPCSWTRPATCSGGRTTGARTSGRWPCRRSSSTPTPTACRPRTPRSSSACSAAGCATPGGTAPGGPAAGWRSCPGARTTTCSRPRSSPTSQPRSSTPPTGPDPSGRWRWERPAGEDAGMDADDSRLLVAVFASPVAHVLLRWGAELGFRTVLVEPDPARDAGAAADVRAAGFAELDGELAGGVADVVVTDHHRDELGELLRDALARPARWIGVMGSPRHEGPHVAALTALGVAAEDIDRVHRPIGLDIGSRE